MSHITKNRALILLKVFLLLLSIIIIVMILIVWIRPNSRFLLTLFPPSNLYEPIVVQEISLKSKKEYPNIKLNHKYVGSYRFGLYFQKPSPYGTPVTCNAIVKLKIHMKGRVYFEKDCNRWNGRFGGSGGRENILSGVILGSYKIPEDVPINSEVQVTISVTESDLKFENQYGDFKFFIKRHVDL